MKARLCQLISAANEVHAKAARVEHGDRSAEALAILYKATQADEQLLRFIDDAMPDWQPITTAPRDGSPLLLFTPATRPDDPTNVPGGLVWVSGGWGKAVINPNSFRGEASHGSPSHWARLSGPSG